MRPCPEIPGQALVCAYEGMADQEGQARCMALSEEVGTHIPMSPEEAFAVRLAVEEACTNIVTHGYTGREPGPMTLEIWHLKQAQPPSLVTMIRDRATPFHPEEADEPELDADVEDRAVGGLGWFFIKNLMDEVSYQSVDGENCLRLVKHLSAPHAD
jgi:serine/threonine-protein kinase RsbW